MLRVNELQKKVIDSIAKGRKVCLREIGRITRRVRDCFMQKLETPKHCLWSHGRRQRLQNKRDALGRLTKTLTKIEGFISENGVSSGVEAEKDRGLELIRRGRHVFWARVGKSGRWALMRLVMQPDSREQGYVRAIKS